MKKIYNNLTIENLMKTKWFNQFNISQQNEISAGIDEGLNVSVYAEKKYEATQMYNLKLIKNVKNDIKHKEMYN